MTEIFDELHQFMKLRRQPLDMEGTVIYYEIEKQLFTFAKPSFDQQIDLTKHEKGTA